jgi:hypothetical protein
MLESFLILLAGGVMLAAALPNPADVRPAWLRVAGVVAILAAVLAAAVALLRSDLADTPPFFRRVQAALVALTLVCAIAHLALVRRDRSRAGRVVGVAGFAVALLAGSNLLHDAMLTRGTAVAFAPKAFAMALQTLAAAGAASVTGLALMTAAFPLFGVPHAAEGGGGSAAASAAGPARAFRRLHRGLMGAVVLRAAVSVGVVLALQAARPIPLLWTDFGLLISLRWLLGLVAVAVLAALARRRITTGRTLSGIAMLLVAALLAVDAELLALYLVRETGLPF